MIIIIFLIRKPYLNSFEHIVVKIQYFHINCHVNLVLSVIIDLEEMQINISAY